jgi:hypothetical protein
MLNSPASGLERNTMDPYGKLCIKDPRNPIFKDICDDKDEAPTPRDGCNCDNCFYGRDEMALEIIALRAHVAGLEATNFGRKG